jgi:hypothetical protein
MSTKKALITALVCTLLTCSCGYIVLPEDVAGGPSAGSEGWSAVATNVGTSDAGDLHVDITIRNNAGDWSAMQAVEDKPAVLKAGGGTTNCETVFVSSGGHRLAPGFQMRGFIGGTKAEPETQLIYVECAGAEAASGATLSIDYVYFTGQYNYYEPEANKGDGTLEIDLDDVATDLTYPVAESVESLIQAPDVEITAINDVVLTLTGVERTDEGLQFTWNTANPGEYPTYVHIGNPPVIGADGIIYGIYEVPDLASVPITPAGDVAEWTTEVSVPQDTEGLHILLSAESGKARLYANYAIDISSQ